MRDLLLSPMGSLSHYPLRGPVVHCKTTSVAKRPYRCASRRKSSPLSWDCSSPNAPGNLSAELSIGGIELKIYIAFLFFLAWIAVTYDRTGGQTLSIQSTQLRSVASLGPSMPSRLPHLWCPSVV